MKFTYCTIFTDRQRIRVACENLVLDHIFKHAMVKIREFFLGSHYGLEHIYPG